MRLSVAVTTLAAAATVAGTAAADGGYYGGALGARAAGRAGAFTARADDPTAVHYNPAGLATIGGTVIMVGNRFSYNGSSYTRAPTLDWGAVPPDGTPPTVTFAKVEQPDAVAGRRAADPGGVEPGPARLRLRAGVFAAPGASRVNFPSPASASDPPGAAGQRYMMLGREAIILNYTAAAAWKFRDLFGVGVALQAISVPRLDYSLMVDGTAMQQTVNPVQSPLDMVASTSGSDWFTFNAIVGAWVRPVPSLQFGAAGQVVPNSITTNGTLQVTPVDPSSGTGRPDARRPPGQRRQRRPAAAAVRARGRALPRPGGDARAVRCRAGRRIRDLVARQRLHASRRAGSTPNFSARTTPAGRHQGPQGVARHDGGEAGR